MLPFESSKRMSSNTFLLREPKNATKIEISDLETQYHSMKLLPPSQYENKQEALPNKEPTSQICSSKIPAEAEDTESSTKEMFITTHSFLAANNPITSAGRLQLKRTFLSSGPAASRYARPIVAQKASNHSGWRMGSIISSYTVYLCLLINLAFAMFATIDDPTSGGIGTVYEGSCKKVRSLDRWLHLFINILGTVLLSASNFNMQCLVSPTRNEVAAAHSKGIWLDIGIPSVRNLRYITWKRVLLWWLLAISAIPLHLLWNSVVFTTLQTNDYTAIVVSQEFLDDSPNCTHVSSTGDYIYEDVICNLYEAARASNITRFGKKDCIQQYGSKMVSQWSNLFVVSNITMGSTPYSENLSPNDHSEPGLNWTSLYFDFFSGDGSYNSGWTCGQSAAEEDCTLTKALTDSSNWTIAAAFQINSNKSITYVGYLVDHCLAARATEVCKLQYSLIILLVVTTSNIIKLFAILMTLRTIKKEHFITIGDAVASFLTNSEMAVEGACLATKLELQESFFEPRQCFSEAQDTITPLTNANVGHVWTVNKKHPLRWRTAPSMMRWMICIVLCSCALIAASILLIIGINGVEEFGVSDIWSIGFGSVDENSLVTINKSAAYGGPLGIMGMVLLANLPQIILSALYFLYNTLFTCILTSFEWSKFAQQKKALRVTSPVHLQRSTYWLQLPYTYGLPLTMASSLMHWLVSQSIFLARIDRYDPRGQLDTYKTIRLANLDGSISTCGYSSSAVVTVVILGTCIVIAPILLGFRKLDPGIPLVGSCSLAISAACHRPAEDTDAAYNPIQWGAVKHETSRGPGHCCLTTFDVEPPISGQRYA